MKNNFGNIFLVCLFLLGNAVITFFSGSIFAFLLFFAVCSLAVFLLNKPLCLKGFSVDVFKSTQNFLLLKPILFTVLFVFCLFAWANAISEYSLVLQNNTQNTFYKTVLRLAFCVLTLCLALCNRGVIKMFAKVSFFIIVASFLIMFLSGIRSFNFTFLKGAFNTGGIIKPSLFSAVKSFGTLFICFLFLGEQSKKSAKTISGYALLLGTSFYLICFFNSLFVIGPNVSQMVFSPYAFSTASVFSGGEFARVDLLVYYVFFICAVIKSAVILWVALNSAKAIHPFLKKATAVVFLIVGTFNFSVFNQPIILLVLEIITPLLFIIFIKKLNSRQPARHS